MVDTSVLESIYINFRNWTLLNPSLNSAARLYGVYLFVGVRLFALTENRPIRGKASIQKRDICNWVHGDTRKKFIHFLNENGQRVEKRRVV